MQRIHKKTGRFIILVILFFMNLNLHDASGQGGDGSPDDDGQKRVELKVDAANYPSADLAEFAIDAQTWYPSAEKDNGSRGAAGTHTFRLKKGRYYTLDLNPLEAIWPDDGTVSLWWNIWSDDLIVINGQITSYGSPISGGSGDIDKQSYAVAVPKVEITEVSLPNGDISFTTQDGENGIASTANLTPDSLDETYNSQIQWEIEDDPDVGGESPIPDITNLRGHEVTIAINIPNDPDGRDYHPLNYRIRAKLTLDEKSTYSEWYHPIEQDEIDMLRQQYIDMGKNSVPGRGSFINSGSTEHFDLSEGACNCGYHEYQIWSIMENLEDVRANLGYSMTINSGYRCPIYNASVGGASESQHIYGTAADVAVEDWDGNGATDIDNNGIDDDWETLESAARAAGAWVEDYEDTGGWVHMDWGH